MGKTQKISERRSGALSATLEMTEDGWVNVLGKPTKRRLDWLEMSNVFELPLSLVVEVHDRSRRDDSRASKQLQSYIEMIWQMVAEEEPWFDFCCCSSNGADDYDQ